MSMIVESPFVRAFVALDLAPPVRERLGALTVELRRAGAHVAWVPPGNLHVSFVFLGAVKAADVPVIAAALDEAVADQPAFSFEVAALGTFGSPRSPRVIWAGVSDPAPVIRLQAAVAAALRALDYALESRPYRPHVTLGRVRSPRGRAALLQALETRRTAAFGATTAGAVRLMRSEIDPAGSRYSVLHEAPLRATTFCLSPPPARVTM
jgi:2'-5' RNA ligase